ncbi:hypothetical protein HCC61_00890 [Streptomyces sp. HNM0575]|nr:hypothetical protein [Streptomyces sp. HNM0575]
MLRWAAVSCALVPLTLLVCGVPVGTALGSAVGLTAVAAVCAVLLRRSEYGYLRQQGPESLTVLRPGPHRGRHGRTGTGLHRGGRYWSGPGQL